MKKPFLILAVVMFFSCQTEEKKYAEVFYNFGPGARLPMQMYGTCLPINDTIKKQFSYSFTVSGDSLANLLKSFEKLRPSHSNDSINASAFILLHKTGHTDTLCLGYQGGIRLNGELMQENKAFTDEVKTLIGKHHNEIMSKKFGKH